MWLWISVQLWRDKGPGHLCRSLEGCSWISRDAGTLPFVRAVKRRLGSANLLHGVYKAAVTSGKAALDRPNAWSDVIWWLYTSVRRYSKSSLSHSENSAEDCWQTRVGWHRRTWCGCVDHVGELKHFGLLDPCRFPSLIVFAGTSLGNDGIVCGEGWLI